MPFRIGSEFLVNIGNTFGIQDTPDIGGAADGGFVVTWRSEFRSGGLDNLDFEIQARALLPGQVIANEFRVNKLTTDSQFSPSVTARADGGFAIAYSSGEENSLPGTSVNTQYLDANGKATGPELFTEYDYYHRVPEVASFRDGGVVTVWGGESSGEGEVRFSTGVVQSRFSYGWDSGVDTKAVATLSDTDFVVTWFGYRDEADAMEGGTPAFYAQILRRDGTGGVTFEIGDAKGGQPDSSITQLSNGNFVVVWCDGTFGDDPVSDPGADVKARIFDVGGQAVTDAFTVNTGIAADQFNPDVAALSGGRFVIVWQNGAEAPGVPAPASTIRAQVFDADGARFDEEFQVNAPSVINSGDPSVTSLGGDRFAVAWTGDEADLGSDGGIKVQLFAADGAPPAEKIKGTGGNDQLTGGFGDDQISGEKGVDAIFAGFGADLVFGDKGEDALYGGGGDDRVFGGWQSDAIYGELGDDTLYGDVGVISAGSRGANDRLFGGDGDDTLYGDAVTITAGGRGGNDILLGGRGADKLYGDGGSGAGVAAANGDDKLDGGDGNDELWGGGGNDRFVFTGLSGSDVIWDFGQRPDNDDVIDLRATEAADPTNGGLQIFYVDGNAELHFNGGVITVMNVTAFSASDILF
ncbi:hypothetical protein M0208_06195 [Sphingomonas sp. SUN019]|uniref:calcium-binding protein n=1 Tax=Sphingomonas sp. SUN019 TaxID=2937788 RepID=UPI00216436C4|nr:calcium-binding protein [Sphingomonas sp. SUN019]UVO50128.1 hypothetical protein M0208_06195 [Sphingomonas sp. SUN019]